MERLHGAPQEGARLASTAGRATPRQTDTATWAGRDASGVPSGDASSMWLAAFAPAGNRALTEVLSLQRASDDAAAAETPPTAEKQQGPLSAAQVDDAIRFYASQPRRYTPEIISQLREAVGLGRDGGADEALVQAVAWMQAILETGDSTLSVDGKAGPHTLPRLFVSGLAKAGEGLAFGTDVQSDVVNEWASLATKRARRDRLVSLVNVRLTAHGVPAVGAAWDSDPANSGSFSFATWTMDVGAKPLSRKRLSRAGAADLADTIYHEARHAEQWFRMAQFRAGQGLSVRGIAAEFSIPSRIARLAKAAPLAEGSMEALIAQGWWDSVYGAGATHRNNVLANNSSGQPGTYTAYRNLPEEHDAWATGPSAQAGIASGTPAPAQAGKGAQETPAGAPPPAGVSLDQMLPREKLE